MAQNQLIGVGMGHFLLESWYLYGSNFNPAAHPYQNQTWVSPILVKSGGGGQNRNEGLKEQLCHLERKYVVFVTPVSQKQIHGAICVILDSLSAQIIVPNTYFLRNTMKPLNHNATTIKESGSLHDSHQ